MRHILDISYKGTDFKGWQIQPNMRTVQGVLNEVLFKILQIKIDTVGSGRTDTGVHANQQIVHFDTLTDLPDHFNYAVNSLLPKDVFVKKITTVDESFHARFDAKYRSYNYHIVNERNPFRINQVTVFKPSINLELMNEACEILKSYADFEAFSKVKTEVTNFNCTILEAKWTYENGEYLFYIRANRFLRGMVRAIVGTMLDIGTDRTSIGEFRSIIESKNRRNAGQAASADGLFLHEVVY